VHPTGQFSTGPAGALPDSLYRFEHDIFKATHIAGPHSSAYFFGGQGFHASNLPIRTKVSNQKETKMRKHWSGQLLELPERPCEPALIWARTQPSYRIAWKNCTRPDWMLWLWWKSGGADKTIATRIACECARLTEPFVDSDSLLAWVWAIDAAERSLVGGCDEEELWAAAGAEAEAARVRKKCADIVRRYISHPPGLLPARLGIAGKE
jgi:hypothetical protein